MGCLRAILDSEKICRRLSIRRRFLMPYPNLPRVVEADLLARVHSHFLGLALCEVRSLPYHGDAFPLPVFSLPDRNRDDSIQSAKRVKGRPIQCFSMHTRRTGPMMRQNGGARPMAGNKADLSKSILKTAQRIGFDGKDWTGLAEALNQRGVRTASGRSFTPTNLQHYCQRQKLPFEIDLRSLKSSYKGKKDLSPLSSEEVASLREIIAWWKSRKMGLGEIERRPIFKGEPRNTGIKINGELLNRALQKAKKERLRTGGSLSGLVEWLLWKYLDEPEDLIESS